MGEQHLLTSGGLLDQPAGLLLAARHAAYIVSLLDMEARATQDVPVHDLLNESQLLDLKALRELRLKLSEDR